MIEQIPESLLAFMIHLSTEERGTCLAAHFLPYLGLGPRKSSFSITQRLAAF